MIQMLHEIISGALERLSLQIMTVLPPLLAAFMILLGALLFAHATRWLITRAFKGIAADKWLRHSGISAMIDHSGRLRTSRLVAQSAYWGILIAGCIAGLNVFGTQLTVRIAEGAILLLPRLLAAALIVIGGLWLGQYLGRSILVWAVNEDLPAPRLLGSGVRVFVVFAAIAVAADTVDFAKGVFLGAFVLVLGGAVLAAGLAFGFGARESVRRHFAEHEPEVAASNHGRLSGKSLFNHL